MRNNCQLFSTESAQKGTSLAKPLAMRKRFGQRPGTTVMLFETRAGADQAKHGIDIYACGGGCRTVHRVIKIRRYVRIEMMEKHCDHFESPLALGTFSTESAISGKAQAGIQWSADRSRCCRNPGRFLTCERSLVSRLRTSALFFSKIAATACSSGFRGRWHPAVSISLLSLASKPCVVDMPQPPVWDCNVLAH
jgi:hypothetical protein